MHLRGGYGPQLPIPYSQSSGVVSESRGGSPAFPVPNKPDGSCGRKATLKRIAQEPCKGRGGRPGFDGLFGRK